MAEFIVEAVIREGIVREYVVGAASEEEAIAVVRAGESSPVRSDTFETSIETISARSACVLNMREAKPSEVESHLRNDFIDGLPSPLQTPFFWECQCPDPKDFIHFKGTGDLYCQYCGNGENDCPDARVSDVLSYYDKMPPSLLLCDEEDETMRGNVDCAVDGEKWHKWWMPRGLNDSRNIDTLKALAALTQYLVDWRTAEETA